MDDDDGGGGGASSGNGWPPWNQLPGGGGFGFGEVDDVIDEDDTGKNFNLYLQNRMRCQELPELWIAVPNCGFDHLDVQKHQFCSRNIAHSSLRQTIKTY